MSIPENIAKIIFKILDVLLYIILISFVCWIGYEIFIIAVNDAQQHGK